MSRQDATFSPAEDLGTPGTLEDAIRERNAWCETAAFHLRNEQHYRAHRDAFLQAALLDEKVAAVALSIVGEGWQRLLANEDNEDNEDNDV